MKKVLLLFAVIAISAFTSLAFAQPANDSCGSAIDITAANTTLFTTVGATQSPQTAYFTGMNDDDVWFKFTVGASGTFTYKLEITNFVDAAGGGGPAPSPVIEVWDGCQSPGNAAIDVANGQGNALMLTNLTHGSTYLVRVYTNGTAQRANFSINVTPVNVPANDSCGSAITLTPVTTCSTGEGPFTTEGATQSPQASGDGAGRDDDVWFKFTTGSNNLYTKVTLINPVFVNFGNPVIELWTGCGDAANTKFFPFTNSAVLGTLAPNTTYYIRIYTYGTGAWIHSFNICVSTPPVNDTYFNAAPISIIQGQVCASTLTGASTAGATSEFPNDCNGHLPNDVWYKFTATSALTHIQITNKVLLPGNVSANSTLWMQVFDGSNTAPVLMCSNTGMLEFDGHNAASTLIPGHTYYVRIYNDDPGNACSFDLCTSAPPPPTYGQCAKAVTVTASPDETCSKGVQLTNINATASLNESACLGTVGSDIWVKFTVPSPAPANLQLDIQNYLAITGSSNPLMAIELYSGADCLSRTLVKCTLGKILTFPAVTAGQQYFIRIISADAANSGNFTVCIHPQPPAATNISCSTAMALNTSTDASAQFVHASTMGSPNDNTLTDCNGNPFVFSNAVWFKFTAAATQQQIDIQNILPLSGGNSYLGYRLYTGDGTSSCTAIIASACTGNVKQVNNPVTGLVIGNIYFVQVLLNRYNGDDASFDIRVIGRTAPANDESTGAVTVIENPFYKPSLATQGTFRFSTISATPVPLAPYGGDVWYKFVAATQQSTVRIDNNGGFTRTVVYNSDAGGNVSTVFFDPGSNNAVTNLSSLLVGNTYYVRVYNPQLVNATTAGSVFGISVFGIPSSVVADVAPAGTNCRVADGPVISTNSNSWLHITDHGKMVISIFDGHTGQPSGLGTIGARYFINSGAIRSSAADGAYLDRNYGLTTVLEPQGGNIVNLIFYFSKAEFDRLVANNPNVNFLNDLGMAEYTDLNCKNVIGNTTEATYTLIDYGALNSSVYYFEVGVTHLSAFYLGKLVASLLPVTCTDFTYKVKDIQVQLNWKTSSETNSSHFDVQRSTSGADFSTIGTVDAAGTSNTARYYGFTDIAAKAGGTFYYRLKQFDKDGKYSLVCNTIKAVTGNDANELFGKAYPNPAVNAINVNIQKAYTGKVSIQVINVLGQVLARKDLEINSGTGQITVPTFNLPAGAYTLRIVTKETVYTKQFSKLQ